MAKIVVPRDQQAEIARLHPKPYYSRVVSVHLYLDPPGVQKFIVTQPLGNRIWLLGIRIFPTPKAIDPAQSVHFDLVTGASGDPGLDDVKSWERILPILDYFDSPAYWQMYDGSLDRSWSIMKFYEGTGRRFGIWGWRTGVDNTRIQVSFEISEG